MKVEMVRQSNGELQYERFPPMCYHEQIHSCLFHLVRKTFALLEGLEGHTMG
jgi:hypothetical protein